MPPDMRGEERELPAQGFGNGLKPIPGPCYASCTAYGTHAQQHNQRPAMQPTICSTIQLHLKPAFRDTGLPRAAAPLPRLC